MLEEKSSRLPKRQPSLIIHPIVNQKTKGNFMLAHQFNALTLKEQAQVIKQLRGFLTENRASAKLARASAAQEIGRAHV